MPAQQQEQWPPPPGAEPVQEGARWRFHRPDSASVAEWFQSQPLDEKMDHEDYVGGVVLIPQNEKVKHTHPVTGRQQDRYESVFTPYMQIGTRVAYFRRLAEQRELIPVSEPMAVPRSSQRDSPYFNANLTEGLWWHVVTGEHGQVTRYLCSTWHVALYEPKSYLQLLEGKPALPMLSGVGTKQVWGGEDVNQIAKAQTGSLGRALGVAGILVIGTGIATAEDMQELSGTQQAASPAPTLPPTEVPEGQGPPEPSEDPDERRAQLIHQAMAIQTRMQEETPDAWREFALWWKERKEAEGWQQLGDVPFDTLPSIISRMNELHREGLEVVAREAASNATTGGES